MILFRARYKYNNNPKVWLILYDGLSEIMPNAFAKASGSSSVTLKQNLSQFCSLFFEIQLVVGGYGLVKVVVCLQRNATVNVKLSVCRTYMNVGGAWVQLHLFVASSLNRGKW